MDRRTFLGNLAGGLLAAPLAAGAQPAGRVYQVGTVSLGAPPTRPGIFHALDEALREQNYVEGRNLVVRRAFAEGNVDRLREIVAEFVKANVDVIVTTSTPETLAAKMATSTIPIVMTLAPDPVEQGLVASLARPGGNVTGLTSLTPGTSQKFVELLREAVPLASRFAVIAPPNSPFPEIRRELRVAGQRVGVTVSFIEIKSPDDFDPALARAKKDGVGGAIAPLGIFTYVHRARLVQAALKHRLPGIYWVRDYVEEGGLMSYGASFADVGRRAAYFVDRILKGAKPADLPVEHPTTLELVINLKTAKVLGLTIPPSLLQRADQVIE
jgi:putative ABC transport system substrate-binding protein